MSRIFASFLADPGFATLVGLTARSLVVLLFVGLIVRVLGSRTSAATRSLILFCGTCALLLLPIVSKFAPVWHIPVMPAAPIRGVETNEQIPQPAGPPANPRLSTENSEPKPALSRTTAAPSPYRVSILFWLWAIGAGGYGGWLVNGRLRLHALATRCPIVSDGPLVETVTELAVQLGVHRPVLVRQARSDPSGTITPMTWGWLRPTLLLPMDVLESWPVERTRAVLLHELAHIARRDWLTQAITQVVCALYWFNPLVWRTAALWEREAEQACDDRVLQAGIAASDYAAHLLEVVRSLRSLHPVVAQGSAHAMAAPRSNVQTRLIAILEERRNRRQTSRVTAFGVLALGVVFLLPIAALNLTARAQAATPAKEDAATLLRKSSERSWRGEWVSAAKLAAQALQQPNLTDADRGSAYWLLFEAAWWQGDTETENKDYAIYKEIAAKHPEDKAMQADLQTADSYRSAPNPKTYALPDLLAVVESYVKSGSYADALHYAKYLLGRPNVPDDIRARALLAAYRGAHYWKYADSVASLEKEFHETVTKLPESTRQSLEKKFQGVKSEKAVSYKLAEGPVNLDFADGIEGWGSANPQQDAGELYTIGVEPDGRRKGKPSAFLTSKGGNPDEYGTLMQNFVQNRLKGKRIRYSAYLKTQGVTKGAGLWIVMYGADQQVHGWNMTRAPILGTTDWQKIEWVFDVPKDSRGFSFGIDLTGDGKVWVDDFHFDVVPNTTPVSPEPY